MQRSVSFFVIFLLILSLLPLQSSQQEIPVVDYPSTLKRGHITQLNVLLDPNLTEIDQLIDDLELLNDQSFTNIMGNSFRSTNLLHIEHSTMAISDRENFVSYLHTIEQSKGHDFNATAYEQGEQRVFTNITGRSYDAELATQWLADNVWDGVKNEHTLFLFNLTGLDQGKDHWFTITPPDIDTGEVQTSFFSETTGLVNGKSVSGWGGHQEQPIHFLDFSSELWYGEFINTVWSKHGWSDSLLSKKIQDFESDETAQLQEWLADYVYSFIRTTYDLQLFFNAPLGRSVKVQTIALFDWYEYNLTIEESQWLIDSSKINATFSSSFNWLQFNVSDVWYNMSSYTNLMNELNKYKSPRDDGQGYYIELNSGLYSYIAEEFIPQTFDYTGEDIILPSLVFLFNQSTFTYGGIPIAGVGGQGFQIQGLTPERYYGADGTPNRGFSDVILHEVGHSLGLPHPFQNADMWSGDMTASVMGYYTSAPNFSQVDVNALGYYHSDFYLIQAKYIENQYEGDDPRSKRIRKYIETASKMQREWDFKQSIDYSLIAICGYADIYELNDPVCDNIDISVLEETDPIQSDSVSDKTSDETEDVLGIEVPFPWTTGLMSVAMFVVIRRKWKLN